MQSNWSNRLPAMALSVVAALSLQACGCNLVGCYDGLLVDFADRPAGPYRIELFVGGVPQVAPPEATCTEAKGCYSGIVFRTQATDNLVLRVTTDVGVRETVFPHLTYTTASPNGKGCGPTCRSATVTVKAPQ
jgi:hypothetical protein